MSVGFHAKDGKIRGTNVEASVTPPVLNLPLVKRG